MDRAVRGELGAMGRVGKVISRLAIAALVVPVAVGTSSLPAHAAGCAITAPLRLGSRSGQVACLEARLHELGYSEVRGPDTFFGTSTKQAVISFQRANGLTADGIVGDRTREALALHAAPGSTLAPLVIETRVIGTSVQGRPITAYRMGSPGGRVVLIVGIIHGDETKGADIAALLRTLPTPAGIDLWIVDSMNPDGQALNTRANANGVDLNRNFEQGWSFIPKSTTNHQYSGAAPADQPETQAMEAFIRLIQPSIGIWYHQDANSVSAGGSRKEIPKRYAALVGQQIGTVPCTQGCTGTAGTFANAAVPGSTNFLVELPGSDVVTPGMINLHASAALTVMTM